MTHTEITEHTACNGQDKTMSTYSTCINGHPHKFKPRYHSMHINAVEAGVVNGVEQIRKAEVVKALSKRQCYVLDICVDCGETREYKQ